jgi:hypothetical protein
LFFGKLIFFLNCNTVRLRYDLLLITQFERNY